MSNYLNTAKYVCRSKLSSTQIAAECDIRHAPENETTVLHAIICLSFPPFQPS